MRKDFLLSYNQTMSNSNSIWFELHSVFLPFFWVGCLQMLAKWCLKQIKAAKMTRNSFLWNLKIILFLQIHIRRTLSYITDSKLWILSKNEYKFEQYIFITTANKNIRKMDTHLYADMFSVLWFGYECNNTLIKLFS